MLWTTLCVAWGGGGGHSPLALWVLHICNTLSFCFGLLKVNSWVGGWEGVDKYHFVTEDCISLCCKPCIPTPLCAQDGPQVGLHWHPAGTRSATLHCLGHRSATLHCLGHMSATLHCLGHRSATLHGLGHRSATLHCLGHRSVQWSVTGVHHTNMRDEKQSFPVQLSSRLGLLMYSDCMYCA